MTTKTKIGDLGVPGLWFAILCQKEVLRDSAANGSLKFTGILVLSVCFYLPERDYST